MDVGDDITEFVTCKIQGLCAQADEEDVEGTKSVIQRRKDDQRFFCRFRNGKIQKCNEKIPKYIQYAQ